MVTPPRSKDGKKIGVFATRAPYRPNPIGLSCVKIIKIEGLKIYLEQTDLLDGSPILDIKPYLVYSDSFPESQVGWLENIESEKYEIKFSPQADEQIEWLRQNGVVNLKNFITTQLSYEPTNSQKKRVQEENFQWVLSYRTWRVDFIITDKTIGIMSLRSGYSEADFATTEDTYKDKHLHREFNSINT